MQEEMVLFPPQETFVAAASLGIQDDESNKLRRLYKPLYVDEKKCYRAKACSLQCFLIVSFSCLTSLRARCSSSGTGFRGHCYIY